jgi:hypothetical protein
MSRKLILALTAFLVLNGIAASSALLGADGDAPGNSALVANAALAPVPAGSPSQPGPTYIPSYLTMIDFEHVVGPNALPQREYVPVVLTQPIDFNEVFRSVSAARPDNTPPNRERLRNAGWKRLLALS